jgi:hypothetical protein
MPKPYVPNAWTDNVTPVDKAHMDNIENELIWLDARVASGGFVSYGTTLPGSPVDGQEAILVDSTTNPSYQWRFRYNASSSSAYKWEYLGGTPASALVGTDESTSSTSFVEFAPNQRITVPRAGDYYVTISAEIYNSTASTGVLLAAIRISDSAQLAVANISTAVANTALMAANTGLAAGMAASAVVALELCTVVAGIAHARSRALLVTPKRVS